MENVHFYKNDNVIIGDDMEHILKNQERLEKRMKDLEEKLDILLNGSDGTKSMDKLIIRG